MKEIVFDQILSTFKFTDSNPEGQSIEADGEQIGFIKKVYFQSGQPSVDIDYVEWLSETEGEKACIEDKECPVDCASHCLPNGYYIRNNNPEIRNLILDESANIEMLDEFGGPENKIVNFDTVKY